MVIYASELCPCAEKNDTILENDNNLHIYVYVDQWYTMHCTIILYCMYTSMAWVAKFFESLKW